MGKFRTAALKRMGRNKTMTHLHHVLQRAEYGAQQEGRLAQANNYAELRKVLCLDARSMEDASASGAEEDTSPRAA